MMTIYEALADQTRRQILDLIREQPRSVGELVEQLRISQPLVSKHLRVLRDVGVVKVRQDAQRRWYELDPQPLIELDMWLSQYRQQWEARLERLDEYLQQLQQQPPATTPEQEQDHD